MCGRVGHYGDSLPAIITSSSTARVVFTGSQNQNRPRSRVGVKVDYVSIVYDCAVDNGGCDHICVDTSDSIQCQCRSGYELTGRTTCLGKCLAHFFAQYPVDVNFLSLTYRSK
jgi:hypothetical protein